MPKNKKPISKLHYIKMGEKDKNKDNLDEEILEQEKNEFFKAEVKKSPKRPEIVEVFAEEKSSPSFDEAELEVSKTPRTKKLPSFLQNFAKKDLNNVVDQNSDNAFLATTDTKEDFFFKKDNSVKLFSNDQEEIHNIDRVYKKSLAMLVVTNVLFGLFAITVVNLQWINPIFALLLSIFFIVSSNIFYIILAEKSYMLLNIAIQSIILILIAGFLGQGFTLPTLLFVGLTALLNYIAFAELERYQLGVRLFSVSMVASESTRILTTIACIVLSLGLFNSIVSVGSDVYFRDVVGKNTTFVDNVLVGKGKASLNSFWMKNSENYGGRVDTPSTYGDFLTDHYKNNEVVVTDSEKNEIAECGSSKTITICNQKVEAIKVDRLTKWAKEEYPDVPYTLDTPLGTREFRIVTVSYYTTAIKNFIANSNNSNSSIPFLNILSKNMVIPAVIAVVLFGILIIFSFLIRWLALIVLVITWKILTATNFVKIDEETVEAEVVSI